MQNKFHNFLVNCLWATWESWTNCSIACDVGGSRTRTRNHSEAQHGGSECVGEATESQSCGSKPLYDIRLREGFQFYEGIVEIRTIYSDWGVICNELSGLEEGDVICKMLGFHLGVESKWKGHGLYRVLVFKSPLKA